MAVKHNHQQLLKQLKQQVRILQKKEEHAKDQLKAALKKMRKQGLLYKSRLAALFATLKSIEKQCVTKLKKKLKRKM